MGEAALGTFQTEAQLQEIAHLRPELILAGIPEIDPSRCPDAPGLVSLGREVALTSGPIDNLYVDVNAVLTFVECKRYGDSRLKREVYPQAVNYASDLQAMLMHFTGAEFVKELEKILGTAKMDPQPSLDAIIEKLSQDPLLAGANKHVWREQFMDRLEFNIKNGICRVVVLCGPSPTDDFAYTAVRNLIRLMQFTERAGSRYDMLVMDVRAYGDDYHSKIVWRRYAELPQIPIVASRSRDTAQATEALSERVATLSPAAKASLETLFQALAQRGIRSMATTSRDYRLLWDASGKTLYASVNIDGERWSISRNQIKPGEGALYTEVSMKPHEIAGFPVQIIERPTQSKKFIGQPAYEVLLSQPADDRIPALANLLADRLGRKPTERTED